MFYDVETDEGEGLYVGDVKTQLLPALYEYYNVL